MDAVSSATSNIDFGDVIPTAIEVGGRALKYRGQREAGQAESAAGEYTGQVRDIEADVLLQQAKSQVAAGQIDKRDIKRENDYLLSNAIAKAAASGGSVSDPTVLTILARIKEEGNYRGAVAQYNADERARGLRIQAISKRHEGELARVGGKQKQAAYNLASKQTALEGISSLYDRYGRGGPEDDPLADPGYDEGDAYLPGTLYDRGFG